jgi:hypothetical protein
VIDLAEYRALAAAARAETSDGLVARERLAGIVEALCDALDAADTEWSYRRTAPDGSTLDGLPMTKAALPLVIEGLYAHQEREPSEQGCRYSVVRRVLGPWVEVSVDAEAEASDA